LQIREGFAFGYAPLYFYFDREHHSLNPSALKYPQLLSQNQVQECCQLHQKQSSANLNKQMMQCAANGQEGAQGWQ